MSCFEWRPRSFPGFFEIGDRPQFAETSQWDQLTLAQSSLNEFGKGHDIVNHVIEPAEFISRSLVDVELEHFPFDLYIEAG